MGIPVLTAAPTSLRAGDSVSWLLDFADYPASDGWVLSYVLLSDQGRYDFTAVASGASHLIELASGDTAGWVAGQYTLTGYLKKGSDRVTVGTSPIEILPDLPATSTTTYDGRSHARRMLEAIEATLESRATKAQLDLVELQIYQRTQRRDVGVLLEARARYLVEVRREEAAGASGRILVRF